MKKVSNFFVVVALVLFITAPFGNKLNAQSISASDLQILSQRIDQLIILLNSLKSQLPAAAGLSSVASIPKRDVKLACNPPPNVVVTGVPITMTLNPDYWCPRGGGAWTWGIDSGPEDAVISASSLIPESTQRPGAYGNDVMNFQRVLSFLAFLDPIFIVGVYGPITTESVKNFQKTYGLSPDGIAGPITLNKMREVINLKPQTLSDEKPTQ